MNNVDRRQFILMSAVSAITLTLPKWMLRQKPRLLQDVKEESTELDNWVTEKMEKVMLKEHHEIILLDREGKEITELGRVKLKMLSDPYFDIEEGQWTIENLEPIAFPMWKEEYSVSIAGYRVYDYNRKVIDGPLIVRQDVGKGDMIMFNPRNLRWTFS